MNNLEELKRKILEKKELKGIPADFLDKYIDEYKIKNSKTFKLLEDKKYNDKSKEFDDLKKYIRKKLREVHGVFSKDSMGKEKKQKMIDLLKNAETEEEKQEIINKILESHQSTFERINNYPELYAQILKNLPVKKIIDLGCGYNPFSYTYLFTHTKEKPEYVAIDINAEDSEFIKKYFDLEKIKGKALTLDLSKEENQNIVKKESKNSDVCLMLKLLDSLESKKRGSSEQLIKNIESKIIVVSFPLKTISGKSAIVGKRKWFEKIKNNNDFNSEEFVLGEEKYYVLKRDNS